MPLNIDRLVSLRRDPGLVGASLDRLDEQLRDGWRQSSSFRLPETFTNVDRVAVCGMGGSHLGADIIRSVYTDLLRVPVGIVADYDLPAWVGERTLAICSSYSGSTEETLATLAVARKRRAKVVVVCGGGKLAAAAKRYTIPHIVFQPTANPSNQPRLGLGYSLAAILRIVQKSRLLPAPVIAIEPMVLAAKAATKRYGAARPMANNPAKQLAVLASESIPLLIGAEWTAGNLHAWSNQINENAKTFAAWYLLPDLNHHLLEGLRNRVVTRQLVAVLVNDPTYHPRTRKRFRITAAILRQLGARVINFTPRGRTRLERAVDLLAFGGYMSWYLALVRKQNPSLIPTVDYLKAALAREK